MELGTVAQFVAWMLGAGSIGGLVSGELNRRLAARVNRRKQLCCLLSDLLELRHRFNGIQDAVKAMAAFVPGHEDQLTIAMPAAYQGYLNHGKVDERYESAVTELSGLDPVLAYELRSKSLAVTMLGPLAQAALQDPASIPVSAEAFRIFGQFGTSAFDEAILRVAKEVNRKVYRQIRAMLDQKPEIPQVANEVFSLLTKVSQPVQQPQAQTATVQPAEQDKGKAEKSKAENAKASG